jgi:hypothetical protein
VSVTARQCTYTSVDSHVCSSYCREEGACCLAAREGVREEGWVGSGCSRHSSRLLYITRITHTSSSSSSSSSSTEAWRMRKLYNLPCVVSPFGGTAPPSRRKTSYHRGVESRFRVHPSPRKPGLACQRGSRIARGTTVARVVDSAGHPPPPWSRCTRGCLVRAVMMINEPNTLKSSKKFACIEYKGLDRLAAQRLSSPLRFGPGSLPCRRGCPRPQMGGGQIGCL